MGQRAQRFVVLVAGAMALVVSACGGAHKASSSQAAADTTQPTSEPPPLPTDGAIGLLGMTPPEKAWESMSYEDREWYMIGKIHPIMRQVFQTFDEKKYAGLGFECLGCHGPDAKERKYKMPATHLSPVPPYDSEDFKAMYNSRIVQFMVKRVTPTMGQLLGAPKFDSGTGQGFSCYACHPKG